MADKGKIMQNEKLFRALIEKSDDMKTLATAEGKLLYISPSVTRVLGHSEEDLIHSSLYEMIHPEDVQDFITKRNIILQQPGQSFSFKQRRFHKNKSWIWCEGTVINQLEEPGIMAMVSNFRDITEKKLLQQQQEFDASNLSALINNSRDVMWSVDKDLNLITANDPFLESLRLVGKSVKRGDPILRAAVNDEQAARFRSRYVRALQGETFMETEYSTTPSEYWMEVSYTPMRSGKEIIGVACHSRDVTERKKSEEKIEATTREIADYKYALDQAAIIAITDQKGTIKYVNENFCRISKYTQDELIGQDHRIVNSAFHSKDFIRVLWTTIAHGKIWKGEIKNLAKDGATYWVDTTIIPFLTKENKPYQYLAIRYDITSRKQIESELVQSEAFNRGVLNSLSSHIAVVDYFGNIVAVNEAWKQFGLQNGSGIQKIGIGNNYFAVCDEAVSVGNSDAVTALEGFRHIMAGKSELFYSEYPCHSPDKKLWFGMRIRNFDNRAPLVVVAHEDISQRKLAEEKLLDQNVELQKTNAELDRFVYSAAHDLRSPLSSILGLLSFVEGETKEDQTVLYTQMIRDSIKRLDVLLKNIYSYSKNNRGELDIKAIDISNSIKNLIRILSNSNESKNISFEVNIEETAVFHSDPVRFDIFMENIISNAIKFHDPEKAQSSIKISGRADENSLTMNIEDNGIGIDDEYHSKIFNMFFRLAGAKAGSGLGLYIVKETIGKLQGSIKVDSKPGEWTRFEITLKNLSEGSPSAEFVP